MIDNLPAPFSVLEGDEGHLHMRNAGRKDIVALPDILVEDTLSQRWTCPLDDSFATFEIIGELKELARKGRFVRVLENGSQSAFIERHLGSLRNRGLAGKRVLGGGGAFDNIKGVNVSSHESDKVVIE